LDIWKKFFNKSGQALEQAAQGSGGVTIPGGVQNTYMYIYMALQDMVYQAWW